MMFPGDDGGDFPVTRHGPYLVQNPHAGWLHAAWQRLRSVRLPPFVVDANLGTTVEQAIEAASKKGGRFVPVRCAASSHDLPGYTRGNCRSCRTPILINPHVTFPESDVIARVCQDCAEVIEFIRAHKQKPDRDDRPDDRPWAGSDWEPVGQLPDGMTWSETPWGDR